MIRRLWPLAAFLALATLLFVGVRMNAGKDTSVIPSPLIGKPAPAFSLPILNGAGGNGAGGNGAGSNGAGLNDTDLDTSGKRVSNIDLLGKPYLLNVWGSWCPACRIEHPVITGIGKSGLVRVIGYNYKDAPEDAQRWLQEFGNPYDLILADEDGRAALDWGIYGAPETFLVDARGIVRWKFVGPVSAEIVETQLKPALGASR